MTPIPDQPADEVEAVVLAIAEQRGYKYRGVETTLNDVHRAFGPQIFNEARAAIAKLDHHRSRQAVASWKQLVAPMVQICEVAAAFDKEAVWNARGAEALGKLLTRMATLLDRLRSRQPSAEGEGTEACAKIVDATADASPPESLVWTSRSLASDAYDRFVMGGWEPEDFVSTIKEWAQKERIHALRLAAGAIRRSASPRSDEESGS